MVGILLSLLGLGIIVLGLFISSGMLVIPFLIGGVGLEIYGLDLHVRKG